MSLIEAKAAPDGRGLAARLAARASAIALAAAESRLRATRDDPARWRLPRLLWPQFTKGR